MKSNINQRLPIDPSRSWFYCRVHLLSRSSRKVWSTSGWTTLCPSPLWFLHMDWSSNEHGCDAGFVLTSPLSKCVKVKYAVRLGFKASNNESEYEALLASLKLAAAKGAKRLHIHNDSQLVIRQVKKEYQTKDPRMQSYLMKVLGLLKKVKDRRCPKSLNPIM